MEKMSPIVRFINSFVKLSGLMLNSISILWKWQKKLNGLLPRRHEDTKGLRILHNINYVIFFSLFMVGCGPDLSDDPIPFVPFSDIVINLTLPEYNSLKTDGGYLTIDGGVRGIILYRVNSTSYLAYERNCSFHPNDACATVDIDVSGFYMIDPCCGSTFAFSDGAVISGVAWRPLRQYQTSIDLNELTITDEVVE